MITTNRTVIAGLAVALLSVPMGAQRTTAIVARDTGATMEKLAEGVYAIRHADAILSFPDGATDWPHSNVGVIVGTNGVLVIDSDYLPSRAAADIGLIRKVTRLPVRYLVNTHWHGDHTHGNGVYADSFPGLQIIASRPNAQYIPINQMRYPRYAVGAGSSSHGMIASHDSIRRRGSDSTGRPLTPALRSLLDQVIAQWNQQVTEFATVAAPAATIVFDQSLTLDVGGKRVELVDRGHANSPSDVTIYLPSERVLFTGDIIVFPIPYTFDAYPSPWVRVIRDLENIPATAIVPGHGPVFTDATYMRQVRTLFETAIARADTLIRSGKTRVQVEATVSLEDLRARFVRPGDATAEAYWEASVRKSLMERVYHCITGSRC